MRKIPTGEMVKMNRVAALANMRLIQVVRDRGS